jgi:hypothetical protein
MNWFNFDIEDYTINWLGRLFSPLKQWINATLKPLVQLWSTYDNYRKQTYLFINITNQTISLEGYLNNLYDSTLRRIYISNTASIPGLIFPLNTSEGQGVLFPLNTSEGQGVLFPIDNTEKFAVDFIVYVPSFTAEEMVEVAGTVENFKVAGLRFSVENI